MARRKTVVKAEHVCPNIWHEKADRSLICTVEM